MDGKGSLHVIGLMKSYVKREIGGEGGEKWMYAFLNSVTSSSLMEFTRLEQQRVCELLMNIRNIVCETNVISIFYEMQYNTWMSECFFGSYVREILSCIKVIGRAILHLSHKMFFKHTIPTFSRDDLIIKAGFFTR